MSARKDALKRQYDERAAGGGASDPSPRGFDGNGRPLPRVRPRNRFWRWFWLLFLLTLLGGFLHGRKPIAHWYAANFEKDGTVTVVGRLLGTPNVHAAVPAEGSSEESKEARQ